MPSRPARRSTPRSSTAGSPIRSEELQDASLPDRALELEAELAARSGLDGEVFSAGAITVRGAREHNLCDVDVEIPRDRLVVITGLSGSGKSTLAFDTIFAEGQRRYVESLSAYARQFLGQMRKPDVDAVEGLSPAIAIDQKSTSSNPRSTVGTVTEIWDYLRLLWARVGHQHCAACSWPGALVASTVDEMAERVLAELPEGTRALVLAPLVEGRKGTHEELLAELVQGGYTRIRLDGEVVELDGLDPLVKNQRHTIECVVDRIVVRASGRTRLTESLETALTLADGRALVVPADGGETITLSASRTCPQCHTSYGALEPRDFSFNSPFGACPDCDGLGVVLDIDVEACIPDASLSLAEGAVKPYASSMSGQWAQRCLLAVGDATGIPLDRPWSKLTKAEQRAVIDGVADGVPVRRRGGGTALLRYEGLRSWVLRRYAEAGEATKEHLVKLLAEVACTSCGGARLKPASRAVLVGGRGIDEVAALSVADAGAFFAELSLSERELAIAARVVREIRERLGFLAEVGLTYLTLDRMAKSLSGGEAQRIRLASQVGSGLVGVLYVLDEPSIGLHPRDNARLLASLQRLRDLGNTVLVVEHDEETIAAADWVIDVGPGAGPHGGRIVAAGTPEAVGAAPESLTGAYLSGRESIAVPATRRKGNGKRLTVSGAKANNLANLTASIPLGTLTVVTGVSGSGKSTLVTEIIEPALARALHGANRRPGAHRRLTGVEHLDKVVSIDQSPIGRTPRSNAATYVGVFDKIRTLYAATETARVRGWKPGRFSFNVPVHNGGGRCEACAGEGQIRIEMHFLPDLWVPCEVCDGRRYAAETLTATYKGRSIADVLDTTITDALELFADQAAIHRQIKTLVDVGLGYLALGQAATTLSGGEAQRVKLASELQRRATGRTLYILDEPTTGLHFADVAKLLEVLERLVDTGNTVLVIEHNLDVIKRADHLLDLGPEGGAGGGRLLVAGTPELVAACPESHTGAALRSVLPMP